MSNVKKEKSAGSKVLSAFLKMLFLLIETVLVLAAVALGLLYVIYHGPSDSMKNLLVRTLNETSAAGFVNEIYLSEDEIRSIVSYVAPENEPFVETDTTLINIAVTEPETEPTEETETEALNKDAWGLVDEDNDGVIIQDIRGEGYTGFMAVIKDPSRVIMGSVPESFGRRGYTVAEMCEYYDAVIGINAGGFYDPDGRGDGSIPDSMVVFNGQVYYSDLGTGNGFIGIDTNHILHVGNRFTQQDVYNANIQYGVCFGPVLIVNGDPVNPDSLASGVNPRTAIGQRSDGAILMLVIDGRSALSIGATYQDLQDIMLQYGAVNACNLDGGSSTMMWYEGDYINNCASVIGIRPVPTTFLVLKEGAVVNG